MRNNKLLLSFLAVVAVGALGVGSTLAYFTDSETATNVVTMGKVDIRLTEPNWSEDGAMDIVPGALIDKDPTVTVLADSEDCYVRVLVDIETEMDGFDYEGIWNGLDVDDSWTPVVDENDSTKRYFYYNEKVDMNGEEKELDSVFKHVAIPSAWGNAYVGQEFDIVITAEAVQADNLPGEFNAVGWNGITWSADGAVEASPVETTSAPQ